jgi:hypothetical protein
MSYARWRINEAVLSVTLDGRIAMTMISGLVRPADLTLMAESVRDWAERHEPAAVVANFWGASMLMDAAGMMRSLQAAVPGTGPCTLEQPTAFLVRPALHELFSRFAWLAGLHGLSRAAFVDHDLALRWALKQAGIRDHWRVSLMGPKLLPSGLRIAGAATAPPPRYRPAAARTLQPGPQHPG